MASGRCRMRLPFRVGSTSYVWPADIMTNVRRLKGLVDDVELVLFESGQSGNIPGQKEMEELKRISGDCNLSYTVHLPLDLNLGSSSADERNNSLACVRSLTGYMSPIDPHAFILHLNLPEDASVNIASWQGITGRSLKELSASGGIAPGRIAVENLGYPFEHVRRIVLDYGFSVCADIGHLIVAGEDPLKHLEAYFDSIAVIHLHGVCGEKDHVSLKHLQPGLLREILKLLIDRKYRGILTLEVFTRDDLEESMEILWENLYS